MIEWKIVRIRKELLEEVTVTVKNHPLWINELDFIRDAIREKIDRLECKQAIQSLVDERVLYERAVVSANSEENIFFGNSLLDEAFSGLVNILDVNRCLAEREAELTCSIKVNVANLASDIDRLISALDMLELTKE